MGGRDPFARRNRVRIALLVVLATVNYWLAVCAAAVGTGLLLVLWLASEGGLDDLRLLGILIALAVVIAIPVGTVIALVRVPLQRSRLEKRVLVETGAVIAAPDDHPEIRNLLEGLAIAGGIPPPRFAVIVDPTPNAFGVGTRPCKAVLAVTTGLMEALTRDELEAVLSYEMSRISSWDVALTSWTVALTGAALDVTDDDGLISIIGWLPRKFADRLQVWALRGLGGERDKAAVRFTRHPHALLRALEKLQANPAEVSRVSRATAPLWVEVPTRALQATSANRAARLERELLLSERIAALRALVGEPDPSPEPPSGAPPVPTTSPAGAPATPPGPPPVPPTIIT